MIADSLPVKVPAGKIPRFLLLGVVNTLLDFALFNLLRIATDTTTDQIYQLVILNIISASCIAVFSFVMNRRYVFRHTTSTKRHGLLFVAITLAGIYFVQQPIFSLVLHFDPGLANALETFGLALGLPFTIHFYSTNLAKAIATLGSMTWNYWLYNRVVFRK